MAPRVFFNHLGQTITDIARSRRFGQAIYIRDPDEQLIEIVTMAWREKLPPPPV